MKKQLLLFCFTCLAMLASAQDQLFKKDNTRLLVKVIEISPEEIRYKLHDNPNGPVYVISKREVALIIFENGRHEVISTREPASSPPRDASGIPYRSMSAADSAVFYKHRNSLSLNFFNFFNMEVGMIYQREFYKQHCNLIIPLAVGLENPEVTQSVYMSPGQGLYLNRKLFETGIGVNYYPSLRSQANYYIGPAARFMQYSLRQQYSYQVPTGQGNYNKMVVTQNGTLSRYCLSITNGIIVRTRSRLVMNVFASLGFKNDAADINTIDPITQKKVEAILKPAGFYFWSGFAIGYTF